MELAQLATLELQADEKDHKKKKAGGFGAAVASTEKIRTWVRLFVEETNFYLD